MKRGLIYIMLIISFGNINAQTKKDSVFIIWNDITKPDTTRAIALNNLIITDYLNRNSDSAYILAKQVYDFTLKKDLKREHADALTSLGNSTMLMGNIPEALEYFKQSLTIHEKIKNKKGKAVALINIGRVYRMRWDFTTALSYYEQSLKISKEINDKYNQSRALTNIGNIYNEKYKFDKALDYYLRSLEIDEDKSGRAITFLNIGNNYTKRKDYTKALIYFKESLITGESIKDYNIQSGALLMIAQNYLDQKNYTEVINYSKKGIKVANRIGNIYLLSSFNDYLYIAYKSKDKIGLSLYHYENSNNLKDSLNVIETEKKLQQIKFDKRRVKDSIVQVEKDLKLKLNHQKEIFQKKQENIIITLVLGGSLLGFLIIAFMVRKNNKRKRQIIEKERVIEKQKLEKLLKDQELNTINAMIEGQEKERQRLANELHDSVGATLSAARLQFEHLQKHVDTLKNKDELFTKTSKLLEEAYQEIRSMAHAKNSGVIAKFGLLPAIEKLAKNISVSKLNIKVEDFGLNERIDNTLEITIFRIIQELVTNIIKHSKATQASISLTQYNNNLNIIIEDNGVGFDSKNNSNKDGMGLSSIEKRIENLEGNFEIDSTSGKGTNILIDIPI
ncbi:MAG: hypothetical protein COB12_07375 [Flavobacterium sp.]|nr:MAG: hypothetical protein COB12_07375 [Flavobacterium sp.]